MKRTVRRPQIYLFFLGVFVFISCKQSSRPDISQINLDLKIQRFDKDLFNGKQKNIAGTDSLLARKYGVFYDDYIHRMVGNYNYSNTDILNTLYKDQAYTDLTHEVDSVFRDFKPVEQNLTQTFKYIKHYYPQVKIPEFIAFVSGFSVQTPVGDNYIGIGLDMFLGKDSKFYKAIVKSVPLYLSRRFTPEYIIPRVTETYAHEDLFPERDSDRSLLAKMIYKGKLLYFMDQVLPENTPDTLKIGYTGRQLSWCNTFERDIWAYFLENRLLYETDYHKIQVFLSEGPFTPGLGDKNESAPKLGSWIGWQIVRKYMKDNPKVTLQQLMAEQDAQKILSLSKYKPK